MIWTGMEVEAAESKHCHTYIAYLADQATPSLPQLHPCLDSVWIRGDRRFILRLVTMMAWMPTAQKSS